MKPPFSKSFFFAWFCLFLLLSPALRAEDAEARLSRAILSLMDADQRLSENQRPAALALYEDALAHLKGLQETDPEFKPSIVEFRLNYVAEKIAGLRPNQPAPAPGLSPRPASAVDHEQLYLETRAQALRDSQRLLEVEKRLVDAQLALREREHSLVETRNELADFRSRLDTLQKESDHELRETRTELGNIRRFNGLLQEQATKLEEENEKLSAALAESREIEAQRQMQIRELEAGRAEVRQAAEEASTRAAGEIQALQDSLLERGRESRLRQEQIEAQEAQIAAANERLASLQLLEDTVIELNRRLNERNAAFDELALLAERIPLLEAALTASETKAREAEEALVPAKEAFADLTVLHQKLLQDHAAAVAEAVETADELRRTQREEIEKLLTESRAAQEELLHKLGGALNASVLRQRQLDEALARIHALENPPEAENVEAAPPAEEFPAADEESTGDEAAAETNDAP